MRRRPIELRAPQLRLVKPGLRHRIFRGTLRFNRSKRVPPFMGTWR
jgi:hypothetical protein